MSPTSRRILAYWLLLLIPTLGVGIGAVVLLRREQSRLQDRAAYADEARRAAVSARARLIAENVELLVGDVQSGLLEVVAAEPADELDSLFTQLERTNPLVRTVFQCAADGTVVRSVPASTSDEGRGFLRRFGARLREAPPWRTVGAKAESPHVSAPEAKEIEEQAAQKKAAGESRSRQQVASNVYKVQNARRDVQALARNNYVSAPRAEADALMDEAVAAAPASANSAAFEKTVQRNSEDFDGGPAPREQRGWLALKVDGRLHLL
ncbi:MAG TPA: hypothetical protein VHN79_07465, partial [Lacunisphaera sp.]|nr:hypothetical protein [Lacunisphaera sp.]